MADLTIRNLTATPLELKLVERFEGQLVSDNNGAGNLKSKLTGLFNSSSNSTPVSPNVVPHGDARERRDVSVPIPPFESRGTDIRAPDPGREVTRLTFEFDGHRYQTDAPSATHRSSVMAKLDGGPQEYTVVYVAAGSTLAIFSSANLNSWMRELKDEYPLPALSIPGTHNSPTCHVALPSVRCQAVSPREQMENGVRFFDIRVSVNPGQPDLVLVHSAFPISLTGNKFLRDLLNEVNDFLNANPSEAMIMSLKREGTGKGTDHDLSRILKEHYCGDANRWYTDPRIPRLGDIRGKIVLLRRYGNDESLNGEHDGRGFGLDASSWPDNCEDGTVGSGIIRVQDFYDCTDTKNIEKKIDLVRAQLERAAEPTYGPGGLGDGAPFFVNFLSASNFFNANCWPEKIAARLNPATIEYLCLRHGEPGKGPNSLNVGDAATGVVMTDWVGHGGDFDLIRCIVGWNAKLQLKQ